MKLTFISDTYSLHDRMPPLGCGDVLEVNGTVFINACILDKRYRVRNAPVEVEI